MPAAGRFPCGETSGSCVPVARWVEENVSDTAAVNTYHKTASLAAGFFAFHEAAAGPM